MVYAQTRFFLVYDSYKILWDFEMQMDHQFPARKTDLVGWLVGFYGISTFVGYLMPNPICLFVCLGFMAYQPL